MPLEGLWWSDDMEVFLAGKRDAWKWTMLIVQPDFLTEGQIRQGIEEAGRTSMKGFRRRSCTSGLTRPNILPSSAFMHLSPHRGTAIGKSITRST
jgi:hypothetical protein